MGRLALRQLLQRFEVAADEGLLLGATPFLHLALVFNRIRDSIEPLREDQLHGSTRCSVALECSGIVLGYSALERPARGPDVAAPVRTSEDVEPRSVGHCKTRSILRDAAKTPLLKERAHCREYRPHPEELAKQASRRMAQRMDSRRSFETRARARSSG